MLKLDGIDAGYGGFQALFGISMNVDAGEAVAVIGSNGAGKTTLLRVISGLLAPTSGIMTMEGVDLTTTAPHRIIETGIAHVPEGRRLFPRLSVEDNLRMGAFIPAARKRFAERLDYVYSLFPRLKERRAQLAGTMSGGEQQMCAIARTLMSGPKLVLLDEPSMGLAPVIVSQVFDLVNSEGCTFRRSMPPSFIQRSSERRRWLSEIEKPPSTDATPRMTPSVWSVERPRFSRISTQAPKKRSRKAPLSHHAARFSVTSATIRPSRSSTRRSASDAMCGSCVTSMTVLPCRCSSLKRREDLLARLRVESARRLVGEEERGRVREGARDRDTLPLASREPRGQHVRLLRDSDALEQLERAAAAFLAADARIEERKLDVSQRWRPSAGGCSSGRRSRSSRCGCARARRPRGPPRSTPSRAYVPAVGESRQPMIAMSVDLPEPDGPTRATNSPRVDREVDAAQRVHGHAVRAEDLREAARLDDRARQLSSSFSTFFFVGSSSATCSVPLRPERISTRSSVAMPAATGTTS